MSKYVITVIIALSLLPAAQAESVSSFLIKLCADKTSQSPDSVSAKEARMIFEMMKETEKRRCGILGEDYIHYLIKKYRARMDS